MQLSDDQELAILIHVLYGPSNPNWGCKIDTEVGSTTIQFKSKAFILRFENLKLEYRHILRILIKHGFKSCGYGRFFSTKIWDPQILIKRGKTLKSNQMMSIFKK